jgi:hypothetical protein
MLIPAVYGGDSKVIGPVVSARADVADPANAAIASIATIAINSRNGFRAHAMFITASRGSPLVARQ